eukprot:15369954-Alexandrium_andersonii.AAC.1
MDSSRPSTYMPPKEVDTQGLAADAPAIQDNLKAIQRTRLPAMRAAKTVCHLAFGKRCHAPRPEPFSPVN